jgi:hypothetical protein
MEKGATQRLIHVEQNPEQAKVKEKDIIKGNPECYGDDSLKKDPYL